ncbi:hypothetical protein J3F83DRAFT_743136 [Trichoderma novae-zelandiae]
MASPSYTYTHSPPLTPLSTLPPQSVSTSSNPPIAHLMTSILLLRQPRPPPSQQQQDPPQPQAAPSQNPSSSAHHHRRLRQQQQPPPQILLLRRAPTDSYPLKWETPGGSVDPADPSVLAAAARELHEEARLPDPRFLTTVGMARSVVDAREEAARMGAWGIPPEAEDAKDVDLEEGLDGLRVKVTTFVESGEVWGKLNLVATVAEGVEEAVVTDPEEHVDWGWFTEDEVRRGRAWRVGEDGLGRDTVLEFTSQAVWGSILESFRVGRELGVIG